MGWKYAMFTVKQVGSGAYSGSLDAVKNFYELAAPAPTGSQPITLKNFIMNMTIVRAKNSKAMVFLFVGPHDTLNTIKNMTTYPDSDFFNKYSQYIWIQQMFSFGAGGTNDNRTRCELQLMTAGSRVLRQDDNYLFMLFTKDNDTATDAFNISYQYRYQYNCETDLTLGNISA